VHNRGPASTSSKSIWRAGFNLISAHIFPRFSALPGDICKNNNSPVPCGEGDPATGSPSPVGDNCSDGIDNDGDGKADDRDPDCKLPITVIEFRHFLPVSVSLAMHRDLVITCVLGGSFNGFYLAFEDPDAPDPDVSNNSAQIDPVTVDCT
jgi:hypothetical protein